MTPARHDRVVVEGMPVSPGLAVGHAVFHDAADVDVPVLALEEEDVKAEQHRLATALRRAKKQLAEVQATFEKEVGKHDAGIFGMQALLLEDPSFRKGLRTRIAEDLVNAEVAVHDEILEWVQRLAGVHTGGDRDPAADLRDVGLRLLRILSGRPSPSAPVAKGGVEDRYILVTEELLPSDTASLDRTHLAGIVTSSGGAASHAAILARGLGIPAVTGVDVSRLPARGGRWVVDGNAGHVIVDPSDEDVDAAEERGRSFTRLLQELEEETQGVTRTKDGAPVELLLNVENWEELPRRVLSDLGGIGLYRTEFLYLARPYFPSEQEQLDHYKGALDRMDGGTITFRTIDVGGDKPLPYLKTPHEPNPVLGWRGLRLSLEWPDLLYSQLRALLRASAHGKLRILLPMVTMVEEFRAAREILLSIQSDLRAAGEPFDEDVQLGAMIEVPALALACGPLAAEADFVSIGTNDLSQYALAVDRNNARIAALYQPLNPGVLSLVRHIVDACAREGTSVSVCGEMAGDPESVLLLLGMGIDAMSMSPSSVPVVRRVVAAVTRDEAREVFESAIALGSTTAIRERVRSELLRLVPELEAWMALRG